MARGVRVSLPCRVRATGASGRWGSRMRQSAQFQIGCSSRPPRGYPRRPWANGEAFLNARLRRLRFARRVSERPRPAALRSLEAQPVLMTAPARV